MGLEPTIPVFEQAITFRALDSFYLTENTASPL
jgi:hypothetical protein